MASDCNHDGFYLFDDAVENLTNLTNRIDDLSNAWQTVFNVMNLPVASIDPLGPHQRLPV
jgi:hypothetical protein